MKIEKTLAKLCILALTLYVIKEMSIPIPEIKKGLKNMAGELKDKAMESLSTTAERMS